MKYGPRSKLRRACTRFLRFSYLLDFVALEALSNIFIESVKDTVKRLVDLGAIQPDFELKKVQKNALGEIVGGTAGGADKSTGPAHIGKTGRVVVSMEYLMTPPPLFKVSAMFHPIATRPNSIHPGSEGIPLSLYKQIKVPNFQAGICKPSMFDPIVHIEVMEPKNTSGDDDEEEEIDQFAVDSDDKLFERTKVEGLHEYWLSVEPSQTDFASMLRECL